MYPLLDQLLNLPNASTGELLFSSLYNVSLKDTATHRDQIMDQFYAVVHKYNIFDDADNRQLFLTKGILMTWFSTSPTATIKLAETCWKGLKSVESDLVTSFFKQLNAVIAQSKNKLLDLITSYSALRRLPFLSTSQLLVDTVTNELRSEPDEQFLALLPSPDLNWSSVHPDIVPIFEQRIRRTIKERAADKGNAAALIDIIQKAFKATPPREELCAMLLSEAKSFLFPPRLASLPPEETVDKDTQAAFNVGTVQTLLSHETILVKLFALVESVRGTHISSNRIQDIIDELNFVQQLLRTTYDCVSQAKIFVKDAIDLNKDPAKTSLINLCTVR